MRLRDYGTQCPHDFSAKLRGGVVLLAALLLACTLMAGAVSATAVVTDITGPDGGVSLDASDAVYNLTKSGTYTITKELVGTAGKDAVILISANNVILDGANKKINGNSVAKYGIKVSSGYTNPTIQNVVIDNTVTTGIRIGTAESGSEDSWILGDVTISGVSIGNVGSASSNERVTGIMINFTESDATNTLTITDTRLTGSIIGQNAHGMRIYSGDGDILVQNAKLTETSNISGKIWVHGIGAWSSGSGDVTIDSCTFQGSLKTDSSNGLNAFGTVASVTSGEAVITNCHASGTIYGKNYAYGLYGDTEKDGNVIIRNSKVDADMSTSTSNYIYSVGLCDWWMNNENDNSVITLENTQITNFAKKQNGVRILSSKGDGTSYIHSTGLTINLVNNKITLDNETATAFSVEDGLESSVLNVHGNEISLTSTDSAVLSFTSASKNCKFSGEVSGNQVTLGSSGSFVKLTGVESDKISGINWVDLTPGLSVPGVITWTDSEADGWTLTLESAAAGTTDSVKNYKITQPFKLAKMTVSADYVTIDGGENIITAIPGESGSVITVSGKNSELKNLKVTTEDGADFEKQAGKIITLSGQGSKLTASEIDASKAKITKTGSARKSFHTVLISGKDVTVSSSTIKAGSGKGGESSSQCIVVVGSELTGVKIQNNNLFPGTASQYKGEGSTDVSSGSVGIRIASGTSDVTIEGNTITSEVTDTSMNNAIAIDGVKTAVTVTANTNTITLSGSAATTEEGKKGQIGGFGNVFHVNPSPSISSNAITINADGNIVSGGTYFIYADSDNGKTSAYTLSGEIKNNKFGAITGKKYAVTPIDTVPTVTTTDLTWTNNVEPAVPEVPSVTPTTSGGGETAVKPAEKTDTSFETTTNTAKIGNEDDVVHVEISGDGVERDESDGSITIPTTAEIKAVYKESPAESPSSVGTTEYQLNITLNEVTTTDLPTISPAYDETKANLIPTGYTTAAMITASGDLEAINSKIKAGGVAVTFKVPKSWAENIGPDRIVGFHIKNGNPGNPLPVTRGQDDGNFYTFIVKTNGFYTILIAASTTSPGPGPQPPQPVYSSGSGNMENAFRVLFDTKGGSFISPSTGLSYGDKISQPPAPTKDGYTFGGWYKDEACTQAWSFSEGIPGDITLYAKWTTTSSSSGSQSGTATTQPTAKPTTAPEETKTPTTAATTAAPVTTTAAGITPTLTQAPAPVFGALLGVLAAGVLLRRRE